MATLNKRRLIWFVLVVLAFLVMALEVDAAAKGKKTTKTNSKKTNLPPLLRQPPPPSQPAIDPPKEWEIMDSKPKSNVIADKMEDGTEFGQRHDIQEIPQQREYIQQIPQQREDIQQIPQQREDIQQIPQRSEDIQQIPQQSEDIQQIPQQSEYIQQIPQQSEDIQQIPQQSEDIQQIPQQSEDIQQIPQQSEDIQQIPQQMEDIQQIPQQREDIQQIPQQSEDIQQIPQQREDIQQIPQQSEDVYQRPDVEFIPADEPQGKSEKMRSKQDIPAQRISSNDINGARSSGICAAWGPHHYRTFGGRHFSYSGLCTYVLAQDCTPVNKKSQSIRQEEKFAVTLEHDPKCNEFQVTGSHSCSRPYVAVHLQLNENRYVVRFPDPSRGKNNQEVEQEGEQQAKGANFEPSFSVFEGERELKIPFVNENIKITPSQRYIVMKTARGLKVHLDYEGTAVIVQLPDKYSGKTCGLCGQKGSSSLSQDLIAPDGSVVLEPRAFGNSWTEIGPDDTCTDVARETPACTLKTTKGKKTTESSSEKCFPIFAAEFATCHDVLDAYVYYDACQQDCCHQKNKDNCECSSLAEYFRECLRVGGKLPRGWRTDALCPLNCQNQTVYSECVSPCVRTCHNPEPSCDSQECVDGCECPANTVSHQGKCIPPDECPCEIKGETYTNGQKIRQDCNTCECRQGQWECTSKVCPARCVISGHHHLTTFDGRTYQIPETCSYALYYSEKYVVEIENVPCRGGSGSIKSGKTNYGKKSAASSAVCSRNLVIVVNNAEKSTYIKLKKFLEITIDGEEANYLPIQVGNILITQLSSLYLQVELPNGMKVVWNGATGGYIQVPPSFYGKTDGLCGTFTHNQADDFYTPEGDTELTVASFARKWRTEENCKSQNGIRDDPCDESPDHRLPAERLCSAIRSNAFTACHEIVDPEPYYRACVYEICACDRRFEACLCPQLEQYALACVNKGILVNWRPEIPECGIHCSGGTQYQICVKSCDYSCDAISVHRNCTDLQEECVDGCACPPGTTQLSTTGNCIPISSCPCFYNGKEYPPGYRQLRSGKACECQNGRFECKFDSRVVETPDQIQTCSENQETVDCLSDCPLTCENMNHKPKCHTKTCRPGCGCKKGYVLNSDQGKCVRPEQCPCHHGGKSYPDGSTVKMDCNNCLCKGSNWVCETEECSGQCSVYGSSHFETFDGKMYDVEGNCQYVLTRGKTFQGEHFSVIVQNIPCGNSDIICSKEITFNLGRDTVILSKESSSQTSNSFKIQEVGLFVYLNSEIGIDIIWDKKSRLYVRVDPLHKGKLEGLCGDFDGDSTNDFKLPGGGLPITQVSVFTDSWKLHDYCQISNELIDICVDDNSHRQWAVHQCSVLKSDVFSSCHSQVPVQRYYERCVMDTCTCESGGNCDCLCTAIAVYADACASKGLPIKWRSQDLCPIQCMECDHYNPCIPLCPKDNCVSIQTEGKYSCKGRPCVEGCDIKPCPPGQIFNTTSNDICVPEAECEVPNWDCLIDGKVYKDGEWVSEGTLNNPCQSCYCTKSRVECTKQECPPIRLEELEVVFKEKKCELYGWTEWMNSYHPDDEYSEGDFEEIDNQFSKLYKDYDIPCTIENMTSIECRPTKSIKIEKGGYSDDVTCSLAEGFVCKNGKGKGAKVCQDHEIRVFCACENEKPVATTTTIAPTTITTVEEEGRMLLPLVPFECLPENHGWTEWVSTTNAKKNNNGDQETVLNVLITTQACPLDHVRNIECRRIDTKEPWYDAGQRGLTCDISNGLICLHGKQAKGKKCHDYEVRVYCFCAQPTTTTTTLATTTESPCPPGLRWNSCLFRCDQTCLSYQNQLIMTGTCNMEQSPDKCVPGCEYVECNRPGYVQLDERTCVKEAECTCVLPDGSILAPGTIIQKDCRKCHCVENKLKCVDVERCGWTTAHAQMIVTTCPPPTTPLCDEGYKIVEDKDSVCPGFKCIPECPPELIWYDCHPRCEKTCANKRRDCAEGCVSGCFCPTGKVRDGNKCIEQEECPDRVCHGFGDPQVITFDGAMFNFQGKGTFIMANHLESSLVISGHTDYCQGRVACIVGMGIEYQGHKVNIRRNENVMVDDYSVHLERLPVDVAGMTILGNPGHNYMVVIPELNAQIFYFSPHAAFSIKVPVALFFNKTKGLCGNCNFADKDDEMDSDNDGIPDRKDILCSWMSEGSYDSCVADNEQQIPVNFVDNPYECKEFQHPILQECVALVDPEPYRHSCLYDVVKGALPRDAACKALFEFTRECCEMDAPVSNWMETLGCEVPCPEGSTFVQCHDACPQTCSNATTVGDVGTSYDRIVDSGAKGGVKGASIKGKTSPFVKEGVKCHEMKMDGCYCPDGMVFHRGKCMTNTVCDTCDDEGHKPGDNWKEGKCTECHCDYNLKVVCLKTTCPSPPICRAEENLRVYHNKTDEHPCCTVYKCEPKPKPTCPPPIVPTCAPGEIAKLKSEKNVCPEYICECDPGLCPLVRWPSDLEPGQQVELLNVACCSQAKIVCHPESCPVPPSCAPGLELKTLRGECCDSYKCKPPEDVCVYTHQLRLVDGAEYPVDISDQVPSIYRPGDRWKDGLCRNCSCEGSDGNYSPECTLEQCPSIDDMPDRKDYVLSTIPIPDQCCPIIARLFCKDTEGGIHEVGSEWKSPDNNCLSYRCEISPFGDVQKVERAIVCTECPETTEYVTPPASLGLCCGWCRSIVCEEDSNVYPVGSTWNSTVQKCYSAECVLDRGSVRTIYTSPKCPAVPEECPLEHIVWDETGCCQKCNVTINKCVPALVNETDAIGFLRIKDSRLGVCQNFKKVEGLKECSGTCDSHSKYSMDEGVFQSNCHCCSPTTFEVIEVELECAKGRTIKRKFQQPTACTCSPCSGESRSGKQTIKTKPKSTKDGRFEQQSSSSDFYFPEQQAGFEDFGGQRPEDTRQSNAGVYPFGQETIGNQVQQENDEVIFPESSSRHQTGGRTQSNFAFGENQGHFGQESIGQEPIGQHPSEFGQYPSEFGQKPSEFGQKPSEFGQKPSEFGQKPSEFGQKPSEFGQKPSEFGQKPSEFGQKPSEFGQKPSEFGQKPSEIGQSPFANSQSRHRSTYTETSGNSFGSSSSRSTGESDWARQLREHREQEEDLMRLQQDYHNAAQLAHAHQQHGG